MRNHSRFDEHLFARFDPNRNSSIHSDRGGRRFLTKIALSALRTLPDIVSSSRSSLLADPLSHNLIVSVALCGLSFRACVYIVRSFRYSRSGAAETNDEIRDHRSGSQWFYSDS